MKQRAIEIVLLVAALAVLVAVSIAEHPPGYVSTHSSYDTGPNGYRALYDVLARETIRVERFESPLGLLPRDVGVLIVTDTAPERDAGRAYGSFDSHDRQRLVRFARHGRILLFASKGSALAALLAGHALRFDPERYSNAGLSRDPQAAATVYAAAAERGAVAFDETVHGYSRDRSFWDALPPPVHAAVWIVFAILVLIVIERNVRFVPPVALEPPADRDSSSYIRSVATLLRRSRSGRAAISRFAADALRLSARRNLPASTRAQLDELQHLAEGRAVADASVVRAALLYATIRKEL